MTSFLGTWSSASLGELCGIWIGKTPSRDVPAYWGAGFPWLSISDMSQGTDLLVTKESITQKAVDECHVRPVEAGTLLMSFKLSIGKLGFARIPMYMNEAIAALPIRDQNRVEPSYLYFALQAVDLTANTDRAVKGQTLNTEKLESIEIPLPPLPEQKRIAAILAQADRLRRLRRYALELSQGYLQSVFLEMFGDPATNPIGWDVGPVEELLVESRSGVQTGPFGSALKRHEYVDHGVPVWGINNVNRNEFVEDKPLFVTPLKYAELSRYSVERGDILISRAGTVGRMCVARPSQSPSIIGTNLVRVRLDGSIIQPEYFSALFTFFANRIGSLRTSSDEGAYSFMNPEILRQVRIPTPPLQHQEHFVNIVQRHDRLRAQQREAARQAEHLFQTLLHKAFRGELSELDASPAAVEH